LVGDLAKKQPIPAEVTFAKRLEVSDECVIAAVRRHGFAFREQVDGLREAAHVPPRALDPFNILAEISFENDFTHQIPSAALAVLAVA